MQTIILGVVGLVVIVGLVVYFSKSDGHRSDMRAADQAPTETQDVRDTALTDAPVTSEGEVIDAPVPSEDVVAVTVRGTNFAFAPNTITVKEGQTVRATFANDGGFHDFTIDEFTDARTRQIRAGSSETVSFVADKKGSFAYYCSVGNHRALGMEGTLTVE